MDPVIMVARRSPIDTRGRALAHLTVDQLAAPVLRAIRNEATLVCGSLLPIPDVVLGNGMGPGRSLVRSGSDARTWVLAAASVGGGLGVAALFEVTR